MHVSRRGLITGLTALVAAPAIVRATSIMPVKAWHEPVRYVATERFLNGPYGSVMFVPINTPAAVWPNSMLPTIGAGEPIYVGDAITIRDGYAWRAQLHPGNPVVDPKIAGVALTSWVDSQGRQPGPDTSAARHKVYQDWLNGSAP